MPLNCQLCVIKEIRVAFVTILNLYLLNSMVFEIRLRNTHLVRLSLPIIYAGHVEEVIIKKKK